MSEELKPCSYCGRENIIYDANNDQVACVTIHCPISGRRWPREEWQRRPIEDALKAELARKDELIKGLDALVEAMEDHIRNHNMIPQSYDMKEAYARLEEIRK